MAQIRYATTGAAVAKADSLANKVVERDVLIVPSVYSSLSGPTVIVVELGSLKHAVLLSDGNGTWTEQ